MLKRAIIFVHYDKDNLVDDYVYFYLEELQKNSSYLIFVSTVKLASETITKLALLCSKVLMRENVGYDFMSYKVGLESFDYQNYDEVVICNDSVYGPLSPLKNLFKEMENNTCDFWGITDNTDISYHLQSYFLVFRKRLLQSKAFKSFWEQVKVLNDKKEIIKQYEVGLTQNLNKDGFKSSIYSNFQPSSMQKVSVFTKKLTPTKTYKKIVALIIGQDKLKRIGKLNTTHHFWKELLTSGKMPFIKIELLRDNPMEMDIKNFEDIVHKISDYDTQLITEHLARMKEDR